MKHPQLTIGRNRLQFPVARGPVPRDPCSRQKPSAVPRSARACPSRPLFATKTVRGPGAGEGQALALRVMLGNGEGQALALRMMTGDGEGQALALRAGGR